MPSRHAHRRQRTVVFGIAALGLVVLLLGGAVFRRAIVEQWHLVRLRFKSAPEDRAKTALKLATCGSRRAVPSLARELHHEHPRVRQMAAYALGRISAAEAVPALCEALEQDPDSMVKVYAAGALGRIAKRLDLSIPALVTALSDHHPAVRYKAADALGWIGPGAAPAVPALAQALLSDDELTTRVRAARALGRIGKGAEAAVVTLTGKLAGDDPRVEAAAREALTTSPESSDSRMRGPDRYGSNPSRPRSASGLVKTIPRIPMAAAPATFSWRSSTKKVSSGRVQMAARAAR